MLWQDIIKLLCLYNKMICITNTKTNCKTCLPKLKWLLRKRKDRICIAFEILEAKVVLVHWWRNVAWFVRHTRNYNGHTGIYGRKIFFISCSYAGQFWLLLLEPCQTFYKFIGKLLDECLMWHAIYRSVTLTYK